MSAPTLVEFVTARLDEDEAAARASEGEHGHYADTWWGQDGNLWSEVAGGSLPERMTREDADHIARHDPARALATVAAHRAIVRLHEALRERGSSDRWHSGQLESARFAVHAVAAIYADHPDYDEQWRP